MKLETTDALAASLAQPLNQSVQSANGAQFALMLSLMFEAKVGGRVEYTEAVTESQPPSPLTGTFAPEHLDHSLSLALQSGNAAAFNLYNCLYHECPIKQDVTVTTPEEPEEFPVAFDRRGRGAEMIIEIEKSKQQAQYLTAA